jgi:hypothetical protein
MKQLVRASLIAPLTAPVLCYATALVIALLDPARRGSAGQNLTGGMTDVLASAVVWYWLVFKQEHPRS